MSFCDSEHKPIPGENPRTIEMLGCTNKKHLTNPQTQLRQLTRSKKLHSRATDRTQCYGYTLAMSVDRKGMCLNLSKTLV